MKLIVSTGRLSQWAQGLALVLIAAIGLQGVPLQSIVHHVQHTTTHHECTHPDGVCPMNPDGPCPCNHDDTAPSSPDGPVLKGCSDDRPTALRAPMSTKWLVRSGLPFPFPPSRPLVRSPDRPILSSQRMGDDIFHPPRPEAERRPAWTLQVSDSA